MFHILYCLNPRWQRLALAHHWFRKLGTTVVCIVTEWGDCSWVGEMVTKWICAAPSWKHLFRSDRKGNFKDTQRRSAQHFSQFFGLWASLCIELCCKLLHCAALYCTVLNCAALCCTVLLCTALYCTMLHITALCCTGDHDPSKESYKAVIACDLG